MANYGIQGWGKGTGQGLGTTKGTWGEQSYKPFTASSQTQTKVKPLGKPNPEWSNNPLAGMTQENIAALERRSSTDHGRGAFSPLYWGLDKPVKAPYSDALNIYKRQLAEQTLWESENSKAMQEKQRSDEALAYQARALQERTQYGKDLEAYNLEKQMAKEALLRRGALGEETLYNYLPEDQFSQLLRNRYSRG